MLKSGVSNLPPSQETVLVAEIERPATIAYDLRDDPRESPGWPPKADADFQAALTEAVQHNPRQLGYAFTRWSIDLLTEHLCQVTHAQVSSSTVYRTLKRLGYRYGLPKLDLKRRQDAKDVARAKREKARVLRRLEPVEAVWCFSTVTKRSSTSIRESLAADAPVADG